MNRWKRLRRPSLLTDVRGASAIEYALLAAFVALGIVTSLGEVGSSVSDGLEKAGKELGTGKPSGGNNGNGNGNNNGNGNGNGNNGNGGGNGNGNGNG